MSRPLRILAIVNSPWDERLGAPRVWMELAEQWRAGGHTFEKFSFSDAFPGGPATGVTYALRQLLFLRKARAFVRQNAQRFDVIDALVGTLPETAESLGFRGLLVARSVGLYRLYDRFDRTIAQRWPQPPRGKLAGRVIYNFTRRRLEQASEKSVQRADLVNVPNETEAVCLRHELKIAGKIMVQPYGLTSERRAQFRAAALPPATRLVQARVCFVGMWSPRKGSHDWAAIIARIRAAVPAVRFRFLGTMVAPAVIEHDLGAAAEGIELISDYQPDDLPRLLADATVGAFPSYVEGFGLAVLEQIAAGLPVVAYDTPGPREILPHGLVPLGDVAAFADEIIRLLRAGEETYGELSEASLRQAETFSWQEIAEATLATYRAELSAKENPVVCVQPFGLGSPGGGPRILRALLEQVPFAWRSIASSPKAPPPWPQEEHLPSRPSWGRVEHSRLASWPKLSSPLFAGRFRRRLRARCRALNARAIHAVPHSGLDFAVAQAVARDLGIPFFVSLHDDLGYTMRERPAARERALRDAWLGAAARFVISEELGREYCQRYGAREFLVVTDGLAQISPPREQSVPGVLRIYFMGLFHMPYEENLRALLEGIALFESAHPETRVSLTLRCEYVRPQVFAGRARVRVLPFAPEAEVERDFAEADLLYLPLPFGAEHANFGRYSLSTKMVTYLGSGLPILYHGPSDSAAADLLGRNDAALLVPTLAAGEIAAALAATPERRRAVAEHARALAQREFLLERQVERFAGAIAAALEAR